MKHDAMELHEIGEAIERAISDWQDEEVAWHQIDLDDARPEEIGDVVVTELQRRGWSIVREQG